MPPFSPHDNDKEENESTTASRGSLHERLRGTHLAPSGGPSHARWQYTPDALHRLGTVAQQPTIDQTTIPGAHAHNRLHSGRYAGSNTRLPTTSRTPGSAPAFKRSSRRPTFAIRVHARHFKHPSTRTHRSADDCKRI